jgi:hypothetical protein
VIASEDQFGSASSVDGRGIGGGVVAAGSSVACVVSLVWRDPPGDRRVLLTPAVVAALRAHPGRWAVIREYASRTAVKRAGGVKHPVDIEVRAVEEPPGSVLYARAKPEVMRG